MGKPKSQESCHLIAACAFAIATAVSGSGVPRASELRAIEKLERYCSTSWRNAGIKREDWEDCTQQAFAELLENVHREGLPEAIENGESLERRELNRAIWRLVQRERRRPKSRQFDENRGTEGTRPKSTSDDPDWTLVLETAKTVLSPRQFEIIQLTRDGWRVAEIARHLDVSAQRISDEKYKAIAKLRSCFAGNGEGSEASAETAQAIDGMNPSARIVA